MALSAIADIRSTSRQLVRALGFMGGNFAGTDLSPSAVHALIEIGASPGITAKDLAELLRLEKSSVSRMLQKLALNGFICELPDEGDGRAKPLYLSEAGVAQTDAIHSFADGQVERAMEKLAPGEGRTVADGLRLYAGALGSLDSEAACAGTQIVRGYQVGIIGRIAEMHALYYSQASGFGQRFETIVAGGLAHFCDRLEYPRNAIWTASQGGRMIGSVAIDGEDLADGIAHLRWFIVNGSACGSGVGRSLLATAIDFADEQGFSETHLWTFHGLSAARHLYEAHGFFCAEERQGDQWGTPVLEQRFVRPCPIDRANGRRHLRRTG